MYLRFFKIKSGDVFKGNFSRSYFERAVALRYMLTFVSGEGKVHRRTGHERSEGVQRHSFTLSLTSALDGVGGQHHTPATLPPVVPQYLMYWRLGGRQGWFGRVRIRSPDRLSRSLSPYRSVWQTSRKCEMCSSRLGDAAVCCRLSVHLFTAVRGILIEHSQLMSVVGRFAP